MPRHRERCPAARSDSRRRSRRSGESRRRALPHTRHRRSRVHPRRRWSRAADRAGRHAGPPRATSTCSPKDCASRSAAAGNSYGRSKRAIADSVASSTGRHGSRRLTMTACAAADAEPACCVILRDDPVAAARAVEVLRRDHAPQLQPPVGRTHPGRAAGDLHGAEERMYAALEHLVDHARPAIGRIARDLHPHAIAVHDAAHLRRREEHTVLETLDAQEAITGAIGAHGSLHQRTRFDRARSACSARRAAAPPAARAVAARRCAGGCRGRRAGALPVLRPARLAGARAARAAAAVASAVLSATRVQLTVPGPVRTLRRPPARVAELVDALVSGTSG